MGAFGTTGQPSLTIKAKIPLGKDWLVMCRTGTVTGAQGGDYLPKEHLGLSKIYMACGTAIGATPDLPTFVLNSRGTDNAEDTAPGDVALESTNGLPYEVWVIGRGKRGTKLYGRPPSVRLAGISALTHAGMKKVPFGNGWLVMGSIIASGASAAADWIGKEKLGLSRIISAQITKGSGSGGARICMTLNAQGTGQAEETSTGDIGFELSTVTGGTGTNFIVYGDGRRMVA